MNQRKQKMGDKAIVKGKIYHQSRYKIDMDDSKLPTVPQVQSHIYEALIVHNPPMIRSERPIETRG